MIFLSAKIKFFCLSIALFYFSSLHLKAQDFPKPLSPPRLVNDYIDLLSAQESNMLESKLRQYMDTTSTEIGVVILESIEGDDINLYGAELAEKWGIGQKGKENGLLVLVAIGDRKVSISTGYGMEGVIPDAYAKRVIEKYIAPNFREEKYFQGLDQATSILMSMASGEFKANARSRKSTPGIMSLILVLFFIVIPIVSVFRGRRGHFASRPTSFWAMLFLMSSMGRGRGNTYNDFNSGRGSFGGGSGFGGFGGGGFGGGGASGSW